MLTDAKTVRRDGFAPDSNGAPTPVPVSLPVFAPTLAPATPARHVRHACGGATAHHVDLEEHAAMVHKLLEDKWGIEAHEVVVAVDDGHGVGASAAVDGQRLCDEQELQCADRA